MVSVYTTDVTTYRRENKGENMTIPITCYQCDTCSAVYATEEQAFLCCRVCSDCHAVTVPGKPYSANPLCPTCQSTMMDQDYKRRFLQRPLVPTPPVYWIGEDLITDEDDLSVWLEDSDCYHIDEHDKTIPHPERFPWEVSPAVLIEEHLNTSDILDALCEKYGEEFEVSNTAVSALKIGVDKFNRLQNEDYSWYVADKKKRCDISKEIMDIIGNVNRSQGG